MKYDNSAAEAPKPAAKPRRAKSVDDGSCKVRVLPMGAGKVHTGKVSGQRAEKGDILTVSLEIGEALEARGFGEIQ